MKKSIKRFKQIIFAVALLTAISALNISAATFTVTNTNDSGAGSLRQAITDANQAAGADTVVFDQSFNQPRTITLLSVINFSPAPNEATTVVGPGANLLTISGGGSLATMFGTNANFPHTFSLSGLTLTRAGGSVGRIIDISSSVVTANISNCVFANNSVSAVFNDGNLTVTNSVFDQNTSVTFGAIYSTRSLAVTGSTFTNNVSTYTGGAFGGSGGAIYSTGVATTITNSIFAGNRATGVGTDAGAGGAIYFAPGTSSSGTMTIMNSTFINNSSNNGGGAVFNTFGTMNINGSLFTGNRAGVSGDGQNTEGGAIANFGDARMTITNSTITGNLAPRGGVSHTPNGPNSLTIVNSTIVNNSATSGGGIYVGNRFSPTLTAISNTIVANNSPNDVFSEFYSVSASYSLVKNPLDSRINGGTGNIFNVDPLLAPLAVNGGATRTRALRPGSPAIDAGDPANFPPTDQRGVARPQGARADIGAYERRAIDFTLSGFADFDGDGRADVSVFRPSSGTWFLQQSQNGFTGIAFGASTDQITPADFDGDGRTDIAVFRPSNGVWYLQRSSAGFTGIAFGQNGDVPVPADYDGDGRADIAVFRPSNGTWYLQRSTAGFAGIAFGSATDKPVPGDYDGDGTATVAVFRPSSGTWFTSTDPATNFGAILFGANGDSPVPADYDGDGKTDVAVFRPSNGIWYLRNSTNGLSGVQFGQTGDLPAPADYDGDGKTDVAVFRGGTWFLNRSTQGFTGVSFGAATDRPIPNAFIP